MKRVVMSFAMFPLFLGVGTIGLCLANPRPASREIAQEKQIPIKNFHTIVPGRLYRGARPESEEQIAALKALGVHTVINLQGGDAELLPPVGWIAAGTQPGETVEYRERERQWVEGQGLQYINIPMDSLTQVTSEESLQIDLILGIMVQPENQPVFIHCEHGADRTGLIAELYRYRYQGWSPSEAHLEMDRNGHAGLIHHVFTGGLDTYFDQVTAEGSTR